MQSKECITNHEWYSDGTMNFAIQCILLLSTFLCVSAFHIPDLNIDTKVKVADDHSNHGLINSAIVNNWQQSLNVGSVSMGSCLLLMLVGLVLYLRLDDRIAHAEAQIFKLTKDIKSMQDVKYSTL